MSADTYTASDRIAPPAVKEAVAQEDGGAETPYAEKGELKDLCNGVMNGCPYIAMGKWSILRFSGGMLLLFRQRGGRSAGGQRPHRHDGWGHRL